MLETYTHAPGQKALFIFLWMLILFIPIFFLSAQITTWLAPVFYPNAFTKEVVLFSFGIVPVAAALSVFITTVIVLHIIALISLIIYVNHTMRTEIGISLYDIVKTTPHSQQKVLLEDIQGYIINRREVHLVSFQQGARQELVISNRLLRHNRKLQQWIKHTFQDITPKPGQKR